MLMPSDMDFHQETGTPSTSRSTLHRHRTMSSNVKRLQDTINSVLEDNERQIFVSALNDYHMHRDVALFVRRLKSILNTETKLQVLHLIRKVIPRTDIETFDIKMGYISRSKGSISNSSQVRDTNSEVRSFKSSRSHERPSKSQQGRTSSKHQQKLTKEEVLRHIETTENTIRNSRLPRPDRVHLRSHEYERPTKSASSLRTPQSERSVRLQSSSEVDILRTPQSERSVRLKSGSDVDILRTPQSERYVRLQSRSMDDLDNYDNSQSSSSKRLKQRSRSKDMLDQRLESDQVTGQRLKSRSHKKKMYHSDLSLNSHSTDLDSVIHNYDLESAGPINGHNKSRPVFVPPRKQRKVPRSETDIPVHKQQKQTHKLNVPRSQTASQSSNNARDSVNNKDLRSSRVSKAGSTLSSKHAQGKEILKIFLGQPPIPEDGFGFSIRGGLDYGLGVYVSNVDSDGLAIKQGLKPGDLIMEVNDISFQKIHHEEAVKVGTYFLFFDNILWISVLNNQNQTYYILCSMPFNCVSNRL